MPAVCPQECTSAHHASAFACWGKNQAACLVLEKGGIWSQLVKVCLLITALGVLPTCKFGLGGKKKTN